MRRRIAAGFLGFVLLSAGLMVLYAADAHPPRTHGCAIGYSGEPGTVHLNQDGTVNYTFLCTSAKYDGEAFLLFNVAGFTMVGVGGRNLLTAIQG